MRVPWRAAIILPTKAHGSNPVRANTGTFYLLERAFSLGGSDDSDAAVGHYGAAEVRCAGRLGPLAREQRNRNLSFRPIVCFASASSVFVAEKRRASAK
jgi:hypothetical protein